MDVFKLLIILRMSVSMCFAMGAIYLAAIGVDGWGWFIFASIFLGVITISSKKG